MNKTDKIYIAGHRGMVGSAIERKLRKDGFQNIIKKTSDELDLKNQIEVNKFFEITRPAYVIIAAAKVGGIHANNTYRADFIYENIMIEANIIHASYLYAVTKLLFLGSSCIYPKLAAQPLKEESLLGGYLEPTNQPYAIAKIAGIEMCNSYRAQYRCNFISAMPTNLYGPNDNYDIKNSHVLPAILRKMIFAKRNNLSEVELWGTGSPRREFLHVDDLADACLFLMNKYDDQKIINIGTGEDLEIRELAEIVKGVVGYKGELIWNSQMPDGTPRKLLDVSRINDLGWKSQITLREGIQSVYYSIRDRF